jgi:LDH2 family malate/lactate/ureidoglycolate dehydrogenase
MLNADHTFGHAAGMEAAKKAVELANEAGTGHIAVYNSSHFGAAAYYGLEIAKHDMIGMSFTNTDSLIRTYAGKREFLGNNPFCAVVPLEDDEPFCLDMATSIITFNKVKQHREKNLPLPEKVAAGLDGCETTNAKKATMLLPIGKYKGYGLSMFIEILCSLLTGMPYGPHIPKMFEAPMTEKRYLGHFVIAMKIDCFQNKDAFKKRMSLMVDEIRNAPVMDKDIPIQVPGEPEKAIAKKRIKTGIPIDKKLLKEFISFGKDYKINFPYMS